MNTANVELVGAVRILVPVAYESTMPDEEKLEKVAKRILKTALENNGVNTAITDKLEVTHIWTPRKKMGVLEFVQLVAQEYSRIKLGYDWYDNNGYPVPAGEVVARAITNVLRRLGYVTTVDAEVARETEPLVLLANLLSAAAEQPGSDTIEVVQSELILNGYVIEPAEQYYARERYEPTSAIEDSRDAAF